MIKKLYNFFIIIFNKNYLFLIDFYYNEKKNLPVIMFLLVFTY